MIRTMLLALAASLLPCASFAQSATPMLTTATPLKANSGDQNITLSSARAPFKKGAVIKLCPVTSVTPASSYVARAATCPAPIVVPDTPPVPPVTPPVPPVVVPDASTLSALSPAGEVFLQNDKLGVGFNPFAGIGTLYAAPTGFRTDVGTGLKRLGLFDGTRDDVILQGRATDVFSVSVNGRRYANGQLTGFTQIPGKFFDTSRWLGEIAGVAIEQRVRLDGATLRFDVDLTNRTLAPVTLGYLRAVDPDQSDLYDTTNTAVVGGVDAKLQGKGGTFYLRDIAGSATIATTSYSKPADIGAALATGKTLKGDYVLQLVFSPVTLAPGQSVTHSFEMGVR